MTRDEIRGLWLGLLGVVIFALTVPMTKLAVGSDGAQHLSPWFVTFGRAALAGLLSVGWLMLLHRRSRHGAPDAVRWPQPGQWWPLVLTASGAVVGFPLFLALALQHVPSTHGAVVTGLLPLSTAAVAALWNRQRPSLGFWLCAAIGALLVLGFMALRAGGLQLHLADGFLVIAMLSAALMYVSGAHLSASLGAERVICWMLVLSLPVSLPLAWWHAPQQAVPASSWWAFAYVAVFSMWLGFFAWYRGLALGGAVRVSQVQLLQPFLSLLFAVPLLGEQLDATTLAFGLAVMATVFAGRRMSVGEAAPEERPRADGVDALSASEGETNMITLWGRISSINVRKVVWCLQELGLPFERIDAGAAFGITNTPAYQARNPNALVPLIDDQGFTLWESNVIVRYLCARGAEQAGSALYPQDLRARFDAERWMDWQQTTVNPAGRDAFVQLIRQPGGCVDEGKVALSVAAMQPLLDLLDAHLSARAFVAGDAFSMADIPLACELHRWRGLPLPQRVRPHLDPWYQQMSQRAAARGVLDLPLS